MSSSLRKAHLSSSQATKGHNTKRSITLDLHDNDKLVPAGNVTFEVDEYHDDCYEEKASVMKIVFEIFGHEDEEFKLVA